MKRTLEDLVGAGNDHTIAGYLAQNPHLTPKQVAHRLYPKPFLLIRLWRRWAIKQSLGDASRRLVTQALIDRAASLGDWGETRPSDLFLKIYDSVCICLERDPLAGVTSPPKLGQTGTIPLTILSVIPDIMRHYYDVIVKAEKEVLLATNYWQPSDSVNTISDALRELSHRAGLRGGPKPVVRIIYDRGSFKQAFKNHLPVKPSGYKPLDLPLPEDVPNIYLDVINFHRPLLGTFHIKMIIVDRKLACVNSNNIQDRPNLEMMVHLEGSIVDSLYDTFLLSASNKFDPPLPCINSPASENQNFLFMEDNPYLENIQVIKAAKSSRHLLKHQSKSPNFNQLEKSNPILRGLNPLNPQGLTYTLMKAIDHRLLSPIPEDQRVVHPGYSIPGVHEDSEESTNDTDSPSIPAFNLPEEEMNKNRDSMREQEVQRNKEHDNQIANQAGQTATKAAPMAPSAPVPALQQPPSIPSPTGSPKSPTFTHDAEKQPRLSVHSAPEAESQERASVKGRMRALSNALNAGALSKAFSNLPDEHENLHMDFTPHIFHSAHKPFPIALVNRKPHGMPGHQDIRVPQDAAWMAMFRHAEKRIFIQTPTFNAKRAVIGALNACRRGVEVILYLGLGFNDKGESIPFQGGTNEEVVYKMYRKLRSEGKEKYLRVFWYTGKDQIRPLNAVHKTRNCHVKFASVDDQVAIMGNGNQDTQSWMHSSEVNILIDSPEIVQDWHRALMTNQNTHLYGEVDKDGVWRDEEGKTWEQYDTRQKIQKKVQKEERKNEKKNGKKAN